MAERDHDEVRRERERMRGRLATVERRANPHKMEEDRQAIRARQRALTRLGRLYPLMYERLCNEERATEGLPPLGAKGTGKWAIVNDEAAPSGPYESGEERCPACGTLGPD